MLSELVLVAGLCNQLVTRSLGNYAAAHATSPDYTLGTIRSVGTFAWSFAPLHHQPVHIWAAQFAAIAALLALSALLVFAVSRGAATFWRVLVATWGVVAALTPVAVVVRGVVAGPAHPQANTSRLGRALFAGPDAAVVVAGLGLGVVVGLVAAIVAVLTRRREAAAVPEEFAGGSDEELERTAAPDDATGQFERPTPAQRAEQPAADWYASRPWQQPGPDGAAALNATTVTERPASDGSGVPARQEQPWQQQPSGRQEPSPPEAVRDETAPTEELKAYGRPQG